MYCHYIRVCDISQVRPPGLGPAATLILVKGATGWFSEGKCLGSSQHFLSSGDVISAQETREVSSGSSLTRCLGREGEEGAGGPWKILPYQALEPSQHHEPPLSLAPSLQGDDSTCGRILKTTATKVIGKS